MSRRITLKAVETLAAVAIAVVALLIGLSFVLASGVSFGAAVSAVWTGAFGHSMQLAGTISKMVPLVMVAMAWIVVFRAGRFHVGFPGQIIASGLCAGMIGLNMHGAPAYVHLPLALLAAVAGGAAYAGLIAWLWARHGVNEILSSLLLNLAAAPVFAWLVSGPLVQPGSGVNASAPLASGSLWPVLYAIELHWDVILVPIVVIVGAFVLTRTRFGARLKLVGANPKFAHNSGVSVRRLGVGAILVSGALAGLAGASLVLAASYPGLAENFGGDYGFNGIAVALLARNSPWGTIPAALLFAMLLQSSPVLEVNLGISAGVVGVVQGAVILLVLGATTMFYAIRKRYSLPALATRTGQPESGGFDPPANVTEKVAEL